MSKEPVSYDDLAAMIQNGFLEMHQKFDGLKEEFGEFRAENAEEHKKMRSEIAHVVFMMTELVRRDEFNDLKKRVELLEAKRA